MFFHKRFSAGIDLRLRCRWRRRRRGGCDVVIRREDAQLEFGAFGGALVFYLLVAGSRIQSKEIALFHGLGVTPSVFEFVDVCEEE